MKIFLFVVSAVFLIGPVVAWGYVVALGCGFKTNSTNCSVRLSDYLDSEFLTLAALPWILGLLCLISAIRR